jgi:predicted ATPase
VIGREFSVALLERVISLPPTRVQSGLDQLEAAGLILRLHDPEGQSYIFKHALVRDAAYESLLRSARGDIHARIGAELERDLACGAGDAPEILAHHFSAAGLADQLRTSRAGP